MRHCPNADCPHRLRFGHPSEFTDVVSDCRDCGTPLLEGDAPESVRRLHALPLAAVAVTFAAMLASIAITRIPLPGVSPPRWVVDFDASTMSIGMLGVLPFLSAALIVEIVAVAVPRWRALRTTGRTKLTQATLLLTVVLALVQSYGIVTYLESNRFELALARPLLMLTLVAGVFAQLALARLVDRHGLGNGIATLIAAGAAASSFDVTRKALASEILGTGGLIALLAICAGIAIASARLVGRKVSLRGVSLRAPLSGIDPVVSASALLLVPVTLANLGVRMPRIPLAPDTTAYTVVFGTLVVALTIALSFLFHRPKNVAEETGASQSSILAARRNALRPTLLYVLLVAAGELLLRAQASIAIGVTQVALASVVALDLIEEAGARRRATRWLPLCSLHRTYALDPLLDRLAEAKIDAIARAARTRAFFQFFAPWAPIEVLVPEEQIDRARELYLGGGPSRGQMQALGGSDAQLQPSPHETSPQASF
ncbi:MAG: hypothetical protein ACXVEF_31520 [Polyangiales bacterium]